jgi:hypothetical protein
MVLTIEPVSKRQVTIIPAIFNLTVGHLATVFLKTMDEPNFSFPLTGRLFAVGCPLEATMLIQDEDSDQQQVDQYKDDIDFPVYASQPKSGENSDISKVLADFTSELESI